MTKPRVLILRAPGANCDVETAYAFERAGGLPERVHVNRLLESPALVEQYQVLCLPGGFSYGDDLGAGRILGSQIQHHLADRLAEFKEQGKLILGICNGFQILMKSGLLLPPADDGGPQATLTWNRSGKFEDRWIDLRVAGTRSPFFAGIESMYLPVAHAEGQFVTRDEATLRRLDAAGQLVLRYAPSQRGAEVPTPLDSSAANAADVLAYPINPNGSLANVAGLCDDTGRVCGLMPHPERHIDRTHHPRWTRGEGRPEGDGLAVFQNAVRYFD